MSEAKTFDAFRLARGRETLRGEATMAELPRLAQSVLDPSVRVAYEVVGWIDDEGHPGAVMKLSARLPLRCERCNQPVQFPLQRDVAFRFVGDEHELNALPIEDVETEEVAGSSSMGLLPWIEDEAILSLPLVPRHDDCTLPLAREGESTQERRPNPFAALARLKGGDDGGPADA